MTNKTSLESLIGVKKELTTRELLKQEFALRAKQPMPWAKQKYRLHGLIKSELAKFTASGVILDSEEMGKLVRQMQTIMLKKQRTQYVGDYE